MSRGLENVIQWDQVWSKPSIVQFMSHPSSYFNTDSVQASTVGQPSAHGRSCSFHMFRSSDDLRGRSWNNLISAVLFHLETDLFAELNPGRKRSSELGGCVLYSTQLSNVPKMAIGWNKVKFKALLGPPTCLWENLTVIKLKRKSNLNISIFIHVVCLKQTWVGIYLTDSFWRDLPRLPGPLLETPLVSDERFYGRRSWSLSVNLMHLN